jgi:hypothetical protein
VGRRHYRLTDRFVSVFGSLNPRWAKKSGSFIWAQGIELSRQLKKSNKVFCRPVMQLPKWMPRNRAI